MLYHMQEAPRSDAVAQLPSCLHVSGVAWTVCELTNLQWLLWTRHHTMAAPKSVGFPERFSMVSPGFCQFLSYRVVQCCAPGCSQLRCWKSPASHLGPCVACLICLHMVWANCNRIRMQSLMELALWRSRAARSRRFSGKNMCWRAIESHRTTPAFAFLADQQSGDLKKEISSALLSHFTEPMVPKFVSVSLLPLHQWGSGGFHDERFEAEVFNWYSRLNHTTSKLCCDLDISILLQRSKWMQMETVLQRSGGNGNIPQVVRRGFVVWTSVMDPERSRDHMVSLLRFQCPGSFVNCDTCDRSSPKMQLNLKMKIIPALISP